MDFNQESSISFSKDFLNSRDDKINTEFNTLSTRIQEIETKLNQFSSLVGLSLRNSNKEDAEI